MKRILTISLLILLAAFHAQATHISGGEIYYDCLGNNQYRVTLIIYRDCAGVNLDPSFDATFSSPCDTFTVQVNTPNGVELSQLCGQQLPNSSCNGGNLPGIQQYTYTTVVTLPPCDFWTISWSLSNRNGAIANLQTPKPDTDMCRPPEHTVDACDDSPQFTGIASPFVCLNYPVTYSLGAYDTDGDSLTYTLIGAMGQGQALLPYVNPYSGTQPITGLVLDPQTGLLSFTPTQQGNWVVVVQVNEYDTLGNLIGTVMRDMQFVAYPCSNVPPNAASGSITNVNGTAVITGSNEIEVCESGTVCFNMVINDVNANNVLDAVTNLTSVLPGATFSYTGTNLTCTVCWTGGAMAPPGTTLHHQRGRWCLPDPRYFQTYAYTIHVIEGVFINVQTTNASCQGVNNGSAAVKRALGTARYQYSWGSLPFNTALIAAGQAAIRSSDRRERVRIAPEQRSSTRPRPTANAGRTWWCVPRGLPHPSERCGRQCDLRQLVKAVRAATDRGTNVSVHTLCGRDRSGWRGPHADRRVSTACPSTTDMVHRPERQLRERQRQQEPTPCSGTAQLTATLHPPCCRVSTYQVEHPRTEHAYGHRPGGTYSVTVVDALRLQQPRDGDLTQPQALAVANLHGGERDIRRTRRRRRHI
ncbi:MAG: hypothetical protein IPN38_17280 [Flavobacteriales bacterium]|nr:hypothetical protein [Flavobacteriales bacterium]